jgi:hypothetical protein
MTATRRLTSQPPGARSEIRSPHSDPRRSQPPPNFCETQSEIVGPVRWVHRGAGALDVVAVKVMGSSVWAGLLGMEKNSVDPGGLGKLALNGLA